MKRARLPIGLAVLAVFDLLAASPAFGAKKPASRKSPHAQIVAVCRVETAPKETRHKNGRSFLEFDVSIVSFARVAGDETANPNLAIRQDRRIHVVHDLSCGGQTVSLSTGDAAEIRGEYVAPDNGKDLIHFTHPADGSCGAKGGHPDGGIRKLDPSALKKAA